MSTTTLRGWIDANWAILSNSGSLIGTTAATSGLGFVFWLLAARLFPPEAVGLASAAISAMMFLGMIGTLGLGTLLIGELARRRSQAGTLISTVLWVVGIVAAGLGVLWAIALPRLSAQLQPLSQDFDSVVQFSIGVALTAVTVVLDQAMIGLLRGGLQLWRNACFSVLKLLALWVVGSWFADHSALAIYAVWTFGNLASLAILAGAALLKRIRLVYRPKFGLVRDLGRAALAHHALNLALQAPGYLFPIVVTTVLSASINASFYAAWMIASFTFLVPGHVTTVLYAVGSQNPMILKQKVQMTVRLSLGLGLLTSIGLFLGAGLVLRAFSAQYADQAEWSLRLLGLGVFPLIVKNHFVAIRRIYGQLESTLVMMIVGAVLEVILATLGLIMAGLVGLSIGWIIALCGEAVIAAPIVHRAATLINSGIPSNRTGK